MNGSSTVQLIYDCTHIEPVTPQDDIRAESLVEVDVMIGGRGKRRRRRSLSETVITGTSSAALTPAIHYSSLSAYCSKFFVFLTT